MILAGNDAVSVITLSGQINVSKFVLFVGGTFHSGLVVSNSSGLHIVAIK